MIKNLIRSLLLAPIFLFSFVSLSFAASFSDNFSNTDGVLLPDHNPVWECLINPSSILNNAVTANDDSYCISNNTWADGYAQITAMITHPSGRMRVLARNNTYPNQYICEVTPSGSAILKGSEYLANGSTAITTGTHTLKCGAIGNVITAFYDGVQILQVTDSSISSGNAGFFVDGSLGISYDDWYSCDGACALPEPENTRVYVANDGDSTISVIDGSTNAVIATIPVGQYPRGVTVTPDGSKVYVANFTNCCSESQGSVSVIDAATNTVIKTISVGLNPAGQLAIDPSGLHVYVPNYYESSISVINTSSDTVEAIINVPVNPFAITITQDGSRVYAVSQQQNSSDSTISVIDSTTFTVMNTILTGPQSNAIVVSPDGSKLYTITSTNEPGFDTAVSVYNANTGVFITEIPMNLGLYALALSPDGSRLYGSNNNCCGNGNGTVSVVDTSTNEIIAVVPVGGAPGLLSVSADGSRVYVPNNWQASASGGNTVSVIDTATNTVLHTVTVGSSPFATAVGQIPTATPTPTDTPTPTPTDTPTPTPVPNVAPVVGTISATVNPVQIMTVTSATASFTDANISDTHTAVFDWGDGMTSLGDIIESNGSGTVSGSHVYLAAGVYEVILTVTDNDGGNGTTTYQYLSVYNPTPQGLFNGVRKFTTPQGSYTANPNLSGQVMFGITSKYQGTTPTGNVSMNFNAAGFEFEATDITALVIVDGGKATLQGTGTVNGQSGYTFLVTGLDGGATNLDFIRFQIKDAVTNNVVFDSQPGAGNTVEPTALITAGNVVIH